LEPIPTYSGAFSNDAANCWLQDARRYFEDEHVLAGKNPNDLEKIIVAKRRLTGQAKWRMLAHEELVRNGEATAWVIYEDFENWIRENFQEYLSEEKRYEKFESCIQGNSSIQNYASRLHLAAAMIQPPYDERYVMRKFETGLNPRIRAALTKDISRPRNFNELVQRCSLHEQGFAIAGHVHPDNSTSASDPDAMQLDAIAASPNPPKKSSKGWKLWCRKNKACFECGRKSHSAKECKKDQKPTPTTGGKGSGH
jgi:hypothetical protein